MLRIGRKRKREEMLAGQDELMEDASKAEDYIRITEEMKAEMERMRKIIEQQNQ